MRGKYVISFIGALGMLAVTAGGAPMAFAHCDGLDGPVAKAAQNALRTGNVNLVLIWVQETDEPEVRTAFERVLAVRRQSPDAQVIGDRYFLETLVRLHRGGEGAPYTGLKPAGRDLGPAIPAADQALLAGAVGPVRDLLISELQRGLQRHFDELRSLARYDPNDVAAGRRYVQAYVEFIHYVERLHEAATTAVEGHHAEGVS